MQSMTCSSIQMRIVRLGSRREGFLKESIEAVWCVLKYNEKCDQTCIMACFIVGPAV